MTEHDGRKRPDGGEDGDAPEGRGDRGKTDHACGAEDAEQEGKLELLEEFRNFLEEGRVLDFLGRSPPSHVDGEHMAEQGLTDMEGQATEKNG